MNIIAIIIAFFSLVACDNATQNADGFSVSGKLENATGKTVYLKQVSSNWTIIDSAEVKADGSYFLSGSKETTELYLFQIGKKFDQFVYLALNNKDKITLNGDATNLLLS